MQIKVSELNSSGLTPCEFNVLVRQDPVEEKTKGGLYLSDEVRDRRKHSAQRATIVAVAPLAFNEDVWPGGTKKPQPGERCLIARHAGVFVEGEDGVEYRVVKDKDIVALIG